MKRLEFSDKQKALIFQRDRGLCAFSGKILWVLHYWASSLWDIDWVDHIKPAIKWWDNSIENWICASSFYNSKKKDNSYDNKYLFINWLPTDNFYYSYWYISHELSNYIIQFQNIHYSDWYLNRALFSLMCAVENLFNPYTIGWKKSIRDYNYYCKSSVKRLNEWKIENIDIENFIGRLSIDINKLGDDQKLMIDFLNSTNFEDIVDIAYKLLPYYKNSKIYFRELLNIKSIEQLSNFEVKILNEKYLSLRDKEILKTTIDDLYKKLKWITKKPLQSNAGAIL